MEYWSLDNKKNKFKKWNENSENVHLVKQPNGGWSVGNIQVNTNETAQIYSL
jgi:hypothetical protein